MLPPPTKHRRKLEKLQQKGSEKDRAKTMERKEKIIAKVKAAERRAREERDNAWRGSTYNNEPTQPVGTVFQIIRYVDIPTGGNTTY